MALHSLARADEFPPNEVPTARFPRKMNGAAAEIEPRGSGTRKRIALPDPDEADRMAAFASLYASMRRELDTVLDPSRVAVLVSSPMVDAERLDAISRRVLRVVNGVSCVADVVELSGLDKAHAVAVLCTLATLGAIAFI